MSAASDSKRAATDSERADGNHAQAAEDHDWLVRYARPLGVIVIAQFVILAALAIGIAVASDTAQRALRVNERRQIETARLRADVRRLTKQNVALVSEVGALRSQIASLGGIPVTISVEDARRPPSSSTTSTTRPPSTTTSTTSTTQPCRVQIAVGCLRS